MVEPTNNDSNTDRLNQNSVGLLHVLFQSVTMTSPGAAMAFSLAIGIAFAGAVLPLAVLLALVGCLLVAYSLSQQAKHMPSAGSLFSYANKAYGRRGGFFVGWAVALYILFFTPAVYLLFPIVLQQVFERDLGLHIGWAPWVILGAIIVAAVSFRGIRFSSTVAMVLGALEIAVFLALSIWMLVVQRHQLSTVPFIPSHATVHGFNGVFKGAVFGILAFTGFEAAAAFGEEGKDPRRTIPRALLLATVIVGLFYVICSYAWVIGTGTSSFVKVATSSANPWYDLGSRYWGIGWIAIFLALINSVLAVTVAAVNSGSRILFAMSRSGMLPKALSRVHPRYKTPYVAVLAMSVWGLAVALLTGWKWGDGVAFGVVATVLTIFAIIAYIAACLGTTIYYRRFQRNEFNVVRHAAIPILGAAAFLIPLYYQFIPAPSAPLIYANWFCGVVVVVLIVVTVVGGRVWPAVGSEHMGFDDIDAAVNISLD